MLALLIVWDTELSPAFAKTGSSSGEETKAYDNMLLVYEVGDRIAGSTDKLVIYADGRATLEHQGIPVDAFSLNSTVLLELRDAIATSHVFELRSDPFWAMPGGIGCSFTIYMEQRRHVGWLSGRIPPELKPLATQLERILPKSEERYRVLKEGLRQISKPRH